MSVTSGCSLLSSLLMLFFSLGLSKKVMERNGGERTQMSPFTTSQWQELEQQALIFKCMAMGNPVPSDLILSIRKNLLMDSSTNTSQSLTLFPQLTSIGSSVGWGCQQPEFGGKLEDPEPWRCRRTDGKKWRCSKKSYPDSKYCEKHMHRGKNRSRKLVELSLTTKSTSLPLSAPQTHHHYQSPRSSSLYKTTHSHVGTVFCPPSHDQIHRKLYGFKDNMDDFHEKDGSWSIRPPGMSHHDTVRYIDESNKQCFVLSSELRSEKPMKLEREENFGRTRPFHFFFDEWPDSWRDVTSKKLEKEKLEGEIHSETELSIAIPTALHDIRYD